MTAIDKIIPVVVVDNPDHAVELARLYKLGGISSIEITLRTQRAVDCIKAIKHANLGMRLGVGTIINASEAATALELEVDFLVSPATSPDLLKFVQDVQVPMYLGFSTISEALRLADAGLGVGKFFPAEAAGGAAFVQSLGSVLPKFQVFPTGGIQLPNLARYLNLPNVLQVGGTWLAPKDQIANGEWTSIEKVIKETQQYLASYERK